MGLGCLWNLARMGIHAICLQHLGFLQEVSLWCFRCLPTREDQTLALVLHKRGKCNTKRLLKNQRCLMSSSDCYRQAKLTSTMNASTNNILWVALQGRTKQPLVGSKVSCCFFLCSFYKPENMLTPFCLWCVPMSLVKLEELTLVPERISVNWCVNDMQNFSRGKIRGRVDIFGLTSAPSCVYLQSYAPVSPNVWGRTGTSSCNLQDASQGHNHQSRLEDGWEMKWNTTQLKAGINSTLSGHVACAGMSSVTLTSLHKEELTRHPIFNSSAPPSCQVFCDVSGAADRHEHCFYCHVCVFLHNPFNYLHFTAILKQAAGCLLILRQTKISEQANEYVFYSKKSRFGWQY